ncbi:MFS transporter, DHA2 family, metal-tetracycline-proton antiporter [Geoalkalibacter ferrihydriticus]|uniref:MFS transporter, DHA2 family, metal-tetracycline-proton antiporter n=1 Tax=Geoalkalibacter ferrihydriticus TaxID=392333 RepID=A0A1G9TCU9_9BACT|nr:MFS transporter [Geoalkalibacter ferrihydriticus]SDM45497.1 MFS transporter, DHA2 family, metal-tetracycline-proton antiporter [Geoalkalibacter ferrihydriticus]
MSSPVVIHPHFQRRIVALMAFTVFFSVLNGTMFNVAVPDIQQQFDLSPTEVSWVVTGFIVVFALAAVTYGKLADIYPLRRLITIGLLLFNAGAILGFFVAASYPVVVCARLLQAAGGGAIPALSLLVATRFFGPELRGRMLGAMASTVAFAAGMGPLIGGLIGGRFHWRYLFLLSLATLVALVLFRRLLPDEPRRADGFDLGGGLLLAAAVAVLLVFVTQGRLLLLPLGVLLGVLFFVHIRRVASPFAPPRLFAGQLYRNGLLTVFLAVGPVFGMLFAVPLMLRDLYGLSTWHIGLVIFPGAVSAAFFGFLGGRLADRRGSVFVIHLGLALLLLSFVGLALATGADTRLVSLVLIVCYTGFAFLQSALAKAVSTTLAPRHSGVGMGFYNLVFFTAGAFGAAMSGRFIELLMYFDPAAQVVAHSRHYSGVFVLSAATVLVAAWVFHRAYRHHGGPDQDRSGG